MLYFSSAGSLPNPPLLFLHGFMGRGSDFDPVINGLESDYFCIAPDLPGHGESILPLTGDDLAKEVCGHIVATLDNLNIEQCALVGYSMGGRVALTLKAKYPERFGPLILFSAHAGLVSQQERETRALQEEKWLSMLESLPFKHFLAKWYAAPLFDGLKDLDSVILKRSYSPQYALPAYIKQFALSKQPSFWGLPATYVAGSCDTRFCQLYSEQCENYIQIPEASHNVIHDAPEHCKSLILKELEKYAVSNPSVMQNV